jgi:bacillithiol system protein YtxJ
MGIFKNLFGSDTKKIEKSIINWIPLTDSKQLDEIVTNSNTKYQAIFKHSTRCGVSSGVLKQFERQDEDGSIDFYYLDLLSYRTISDEIATKFGVMHQSPQLIVFKNGVAATHASHYDIMSVALEEF